MIRKLKRLDPSKELFRTVKGNIGIKNSNRRWKDYGKSQEGGGGAGEMEEYQTKDSYGNVISWYVNTSSKIVFSWTIITLNKDKPLDPEYHIEQLRTQMGGINENDTHTASVLANFRSEFSDRLLGEEY
ncbi:MAG: hypothetical protein E7Y34_02725 [Mycoplasma sp.]|nr:hypothetical protein [Mycoplasma sp.]